MIAEYVNAEVDSISAQGMFIIIVKVWSYDGWGTEIQTQCQRVEEYMPAYSMFTTWDRY